MQRTAKPHVVFSPIKTAPRLKDMAPPAVVIWTEAEALDGSTFKIPASSFVTSRYDLEMPRPYHFALVCYSSRPLIPLKREYRIGFNQLRNLRTGRPVGTSQVTAVVQRAGSLAKDSLMYDVAILAELVYPYFVRLKRARKLEHSTFSARAQSTGSV